MENLCYFAEERILCWIAGYTRDNNTDLLDDKLKSLNENSKKFSELTGVKPNQVNTFTVDTSRRYKHMRVFYAKDVDNTCNAFEFNNWKFMQYIQD